MGKQDVIEIDGVVVDTLPNAMFKVKLANGHEILAHVSGKIRMHHLSNQYAISAALSNVKAASWLFAKIQNTNRDRETNGGVM